MSDARTVHMSAVYDARAYFHGSKDASAAVLARLENELGSFEAALSRLQDGSYVDDLMHQFGHALPGYQPYINLVARVDR